MKTIYFSILLFSITFLLAQTTSKTKNTPPVKITKNSNSKTIETDKNKITIEEGKSNPTAKPFAFLGSYTMNIKNTSKKGKINNGVIKYAFDNYKMVSIPTFTDSKDLNMRSILDVKENTMTMLFNDKKGEKEGMIIKIPKIIIADKNEKDLSKKYIINKTGETKQIDGYKCEKWIITLEDGSTAVSWVTKDISINTAEALSYLKTSLKGKKNALNFNGMELNGCVIESTYTAKDGEIIYMKMTDIKKGKPDAALFSTEGFQLIDMSTFPFGR